MSHQRIIELPAMKANRQTCVYMSAGCFAGIMEHCTMYPVDSVKTRMQSLRTNPNAVYNGIIHAMREMMMKEGILRPWRGINIVAMGAGPAHALYFTSYEYMKKLLGGKMYGGDTVLHIVSAAVATFFHDGTMNPVEVIKQRLQMYNSPYKGVWDCASNIFKTEGISPLYRSFITNLTMNIPFHCLHFVTYELMMKTLNPDTNYNPIVHVISGGTAGGIAAACTSPLDVAKTLLNTQEKSVLVECNTNANKNIRGMFNALRTIYNIHGIRGYFRGVRARVMFQIPSTALSWSVYEFFKHSLSLQITEEQIIELTH